jgi:hypothetical protein
MNHERTEDLERGMDLIPKLAEIMPDQADERIRPIYEDIQRTLRVPFVNFIFRSLTNYPDSVESAWGHLAPVLLTRAFETASDDLRARALLEPVPDASGADWETLGDMDRWRRDAESPTSTCCSRPGRSPATSTRASQSVRKLLDMQPWPPLRGRASGESVPQPEAASSAAQRSGRRRGAGICMRECGLGGAAAPNQTDPAASRLPRLR